MNSDASRAARADTLTRADSDGAVSIRPLKKTNCEPTATITATA
jgi:hypothetical protein